jgi:hypothetical protein
LSPAAHYPEAPPPREVSDHTARPARDRMKSPKGPSPENLVFGRSIMRSLTRRLVRNKKKK